MLIEVHIIQNHAPSNLNRDESGSPKTAIFGGYRRARISSQCLKRCYRTSKTFRNEVDGLGMHTRDMPDEVIRRVQKELTEDEQKKLKAALVKAIKKGETGAGGSSDSGQAQDKTAQSVFWRESELNTLADGIRIWADGDKKQDFDPKAALESVRLNWTGMPVDMALFGRMVTSELMHNIEASSQFAHAISTHEFTREFDFWTRVDDRRDKRLDWYRDAYGSEKIPEGTDGMGDAEFTSACYYSYFNVDFDGLIDNLTGKALKHSDDSKDREEAKRLACNAVVGLLKAAIFERPTGKFNSMATPSLPSLVLVEVRDSHVAVSYADAFAKPVDPKNKEEQSDTGQIQRVDLRIESANRLLQEAERIRKAFKLDARTRLLFPGGFDIDSETGLLQSVYEAKNNAAEKRGTALKEKESAAKFTKVSDVDELIDKVKDALGCAEAKTNA